MKKTNIREIALQILGKKYRVIFILIWVSIAMWFLPAIISSIISVDSLWFIPFVIIGGMSFFVLTFIYCSIVSSVKKSLRTLVKTGKIGYVDEILSGDYNVSDKVYFSRNLMYCTKFHTLVAYDDILWVYINVVNGFQKLSVFNTIDGKSYNLDLDEVLIKELIVRKKDIIVGFSPENKALYDKAVKQFNSKRKAEI